VCPAVVRRVVCELVRANAGGPSFSLLTSLLRCVPLSRRLGDLFLLPLLLLPNFLNYI
jgi:hypothetical protein